MHSLDMASTPTQIRSSGENTTSISSLTGTTEALTLVEVGATTCPEGKEGIFGAPECLSASLALLENTLGGVAHSEPDSQFIVWWEEPEDQDPENPRNWSPWMKWTNIITISLISFVV